MLIYITQHNSICSFIKISRDSSINIENKPLPTSFIMTFKVLVVAALIISFWMSGDANFKFSGEFSNVTTLISSLWLTRNAIAQESYLNFLNFQIHQSPRKASPCIRRTHTQSIDTLKPLLYSLWAWSDCLKKNISRCWL